MLTSHITRLSPSNKASQKLLVSVNHKLHFVQSQQFKEMGGNIIYVCTTYWEMFIPGRNS